MYGLSWCRASKSSVHCLSTLSIIYISCCLGWMSFGQEPCSALLSTGNGNNSPVSAITGVYPGVVHKLGGFGQNSGGAGIGRCCITYHADLGQARLLGGTIKKSQLFGWMWVWVSVQKRPIIHVMCLYWQVQSAKWLKKCVGISASAKWVYFEGWCHIITSRFNQPVSTNNNQTPLSLVLTGSRIIT